MTISTDTFAIDIDCPPALAGYLGQLLWTIEGVTGVMELYSNPDAAETTPDDLDVIRVFALPNPLVLDNLRQMLALEPALKECQIHAQHNLKEEDWAEHWKKYWHVTHISDRITICPGWERDAYTPKADEMVITLDPGSAFGTGAHATTSLMLKAIEVLADEKYFSQLAILDVGTGSGILALACALMGCRNITAIDTCPNAVEVTRENATINNVQAITASTTPLADLCLTPYDVILANIIAPVILELMPELVRRLLPNGVLVLGGLIGKNLPDIEQSLKQHGLTNIVQQRDGDWYAVIARR